MLGRHRAWIGALFVGLVVVCAGCQKKSDSKPSAPAGTAAPAAKQQQAESVRIDTASMTKAEQLPPSIPQVILSEELRAGCLVDVGSLLPDVKLLDIAGTPHRLQSLYGKKLTVVCFWTIGSTNRSRLVAGELMQYLAKRIAEPFSREGVAVIAINVDDEAKAVQREIAHLPETVSCLLDQTGECFSLVAKDKRMPRTFLLDADGCILWFDIEYSRALRRDLVQSIRAALETPHRP